MRVPAWKHAMPDHSACTCSAMSVCCTRWLSASQTLVLVSLLSHVCTCLSIHSQPALKLLQHLVVGYAEYMMSSGFEAMVARIAGHPGTILSQVESKAFEEWAPGFYERLRSHMKRASDSIGLGASTLLACHQSIWISLSHVRTTGNRCLHMGHKAKLPFLPTDVYVVSAGHQHTSPGQASGNGWSF